MKIFQDSDGHIEHHHRSNHDITKTNYQSSEVPSDPVGIPSSLPPLSRSIPQTQNLSRNLSLKDLESSVKDEEVSTLGALKIQVQPQTPAVVTTSLLPPITAAHSD